MSTDLVSWLRSQLDTDEEIARAASRNSPDWSEDSSWLTDMLDPLPSQRRGRPGWLPMIEREDIRHIATNDPARVLRTIAAHRTILKLHGRPHECSTLRGGEIDNCTWVPDPAECSTLLLLAAIFDQRPGFDPSWKVET